MDYNEFETFKMIVNSINRAKYIKHWLENESKPTINF